MFIKSGQGLFCIYRFTILAPKVMRLQMDNRVYILEQALQLKSNVCTSGGMIKEFPESMLKPFYSFGTGFIVCRSGGFDFMVGAEKYTAKAGDTVFVPDDKVFKVVESGEGLEIYVLLFQIDQIKDVLGTSLMSMQLYYKFSNDSLYVWNTGHEEELIHYVHLVSSTQTAEEDGFAFYERKLLLISLTYNLCSIFQHKLLKNNTAGARQTEVFLKLIQLVDEYHASERGVEFYADKLCLSPKYLSELSKSICGYTVQELVFKAIVREGKRLLATSNKTIQEISVDFNFPNQSSFGTFFKRHVGVSPQNYRNMIGEEDRD